MYSSKPKVNSLNIVQFLGSCSDRPLGMETGEIFDGSITASSEENDTPAKNGRLNYNAGKSWCAGTQDNNPFLQIDLGTNFVLCAVATQGNSQAEDWVETYQLQTSNDGLNWTDYKEERQVRVCDEIIWPYGLRSMWAKSAPWGWEEAAYPTGTWMRGLADSIRPWPYSRPKICLFLTVQEKVRLLLTPFKSGPM